jgi:hypothetical protein
MQTTTHNGRTEMLNILVNPYIKEKFEWFLEHKGITLEDVE